MELTLLGTGAPQGLPRAGCPCAACATAVGPEARAATSVLVEGTVLLDLTPGPAAAAARAGRSLVGVRQVLLSHPHGPHRRAGTGPATDGVPAPARVPTGGELVVLDGLRIRAVPLDAPGPGHTGYDVTGPGGRRLLYLPPGCAPAADGTEAAAGPYHTVLLDAVSRPDGLARLRATGAVTEATEVFAVHLDHHRPTGPELRRRLAAAGVRVVPDGTTVTVGAATSGEAPRPDVPRPPRRTLVLGGARSGKSLEAERRLAAHPDVVYVATGGGAEGDPEWAERLAAHRARRPAGWRTAETGDPVPLLAAADPAPLLIDCLTLWLSRVMDEVGAWDDDTWRRTGQRALAERVAALVDAVRTTSRTVVAVSNEAGWGVVPATPAGRRFRDELGRLNRAVAAECEEVLLVVAGTALPLRG